MELLTNDLSVHEQFQDIATFREAFFACDGHAKHRTTLWTRGSLPWDASERQTDSRYVNATGDHGIRPRE